MVMRYRKLTEDGDMRFGAGQKDFYRDDPLGVAQAVVTRLKLWSGEWFIDLVEGTPYQVYALGKHTMVTISPMLRERVLQTPEVTELLAFEPLFDADERVYDVRISINTTFGPAEFTGVL